MVTIVRLVIILMLFRVKRPRLQVEFLSSLDLSIELERSELPVEMPGVVALATNLRVNAVRPAVLSL